MLPVLFAVFLLWLVLVKGRHLLARLPVALAGLLSAALAVGNTLIGHFFAPMGILFTPVVVVLAAGAIMLSRGSRSPGKALVLSAVVIGHDVGLKLYAGGSHDLEGQGFMTAFLFLGLLPAYGVIVFCVRTMTAEPRYSRALGLLLLPLLLAGYLYFFGNLGLGRYYD